MKQLKSTILFFLLSTSMIFSQTDWTGNISSDWGDPGNWTAGVPDLMDDVTIPDMPNDPEVMNGTIATAKFIWVEADAALKVNNGGSLSIIGSDDSGLLNRGSVINEGAFIIDETGGHGINQFNATFINRSILSIGATGFIGGHGIALGGDFVNESGIITIDRSTYSGIYMFSGTFTNQATLQIGSIADIALAGIASNAPGNFINDEGALLTIDRNQSFNPITMFAGNFTNRGTIEIGGLEPVKNAGIYNNGTFANESGMLSIDQTSSMGIDNVSVFVNLATINVGQNGGDIKNHGIQVGGANALFENEGGIINIDNIGTYYGDADGIFCYGQAIFLNKSGGQIYLGQNGTLVSEGIACITEAAFINDASTVTIDNTGRWGVELWNIGNFENKNGGQLLIGQNTGNIGNNGIQIHGGATNFQNLSGAEIRIDNTARFGIGCSGNLTNESTINIGQNAGAISSIGFAITTNGFVSNIGGSIHIDNTADHGMSLYTSTFENQNGGQLLIGQLGGVARVGIIQFGNGNFVNDASTIKIDNARWGYWTQGDPNVGTNKNGGQIIIGQNGPITDLGILNSQVSTFENQACSVLQLYKNMVNYGVLNNFGLLTTNTNVGHFNNGTVMNNGIIANQEGSSIPNVINNEIIIAQTMDDCQVVSPAFDLGNPLDFNILGIYTDAGASNPAGTYNAAANAFYPSIPAGSHTLYVKIEDPVGGCTQTVSWTVTIGNIPATTWYRDWDGDGFTDGSTLQDCTRPAGYSMHQELSNPYVTDCDDNDPNAFPGQTWYKDADDDGYSNGTYTNSCLRPPGYKTAAELAQTNGDCNDNSPSIHPGATELCNGIDEDCDGEVDEGASGGATYTGSVSFNTQAQLDAWPACYSTIQGNLTIQGGSINDLGPLANITTVTGNISIIANMTLTSLSGLENLTTVGSNFSMYYNFQLANCCAIDDLLTNGGVGGTTTIFYNKTGSHCNSAAAIMAACPVNPLIAGGTNGAATATSCSDCVPSNLLQVFPNPASTTIDVKWSGENPSGTVQLTDLLGRVLMEQELQSENQFHVFQLRSGNYAVRVKADGYKQQVERVVVDR